jgi:hypothetical protein
VACSKNQTEDVQEQPNGRANGGPDELVHGGIERVLGLGQALGGVRDQFFIVVD